MTGRTLGWRTRSSSVAARDGISRPICSSYQVTGTMPHPGPSAPAVSSSSALSRAPPRASRVWWNAS